LTIVTPALIEEEGIGSAIERCSYSVVDLLKSVRYFEGAELGSLDDSSTELGTANALRDAWKKIWCFHRLITTISGPFR